MRHEKVPAAPDTPLPHLVRKALREGWPTSDANKPAIVDDLIAAVHDPNTDTALLDETQEQLDQYQR